MPKSDVTWRGVLIFVAAAAILFSGRAWLKHDAEAEAKEALLGALPAFSCKDMSFDTKYWRWRADIGANGTSTYSALGMSYGCRTQLRQGVRSAEWPLQKPCLSGGQCWWTTRGGAELMLRFERDKVWYSYQKLRDMRCLAESCPPETRLR
ncbi:MAG: hypothetical protein CVT74_18330 [Alphaproteobacteria bacterium HGW-Alphaproteobacteria-13]|jgi:hypothetical protein|nr:MAG: hypothetical protein CVT74_18330 [Alphaproteobacteria bacterium HGW-Alphaproteobacteria-13]